MSMAIIGTGSDLPGTAITNEMLAAEVEDWDSARAGCTLDEWVLDKVGIGTRYQRHEDEGTTIMAIRACQRALDNAGVDARDVDLLVMATFTSDHRLPQGVNVVQAELGMTAKCIQIEAACSGFIDGMIVADALMKSLGYTTALVVHAEASTSVLNPKKFMTRAIFGDGAGAVVVRSDPSGETGLLSYATNTDGTKSKWLTAAGGTLSPITPENRADGSAYLWFDYKRIFDDAVERLVETSIEVVTRAGDTLDDIDYVVAHQANIRIIEAVARQVNMDFSKFLVNIGHVGNTSGATIPIALDEFNRNGTLKPGQKVLMPTVGAGLSWGAIYVVWAPCGVDREIDATTQDAEELSLRP